MSTSKAAAKPAKKKTGDDEKGLLTKRANNVTIGTLGEVKGAEGEASESWVTRAHEDQNYVYRDFSQIPEEDFDVDYEIDQEGLLQVSADARGRFCRQNLLVCLVHSLT